MPLFLLIFPILFLLKSKDNSSETPNESLSTKEYFLISILTIALYIYSQIKLNIHLAHLGVNNYVQLFPIWLVIVIIPIIVGMVIWSLIKNKRKIPVKGRVSLKFIKI